MQPLGLHTPSGTPGRAPFHKRAAGPVCSVPDGAQTCVALRESQAPPLGDPLAPAGGHGTAHAPHAPTGLSGGAEWTKRGPKRPKTEANPIPGPNAHQTHQSIPPGPDQAKVGQSRLVSISPNLSLRDKGQEPPTSAPPNKSIRMSSTTGRGMGEGKKKEKERRCLDLSSTATW